VIFRARAARFDEEYARVARQLRELALEEFGCLEFIAICEDNQEIALSYWPDQACIQRWKQQADHLMAQQLGRERWYADYCVEITQVLRAYAKPES
jgi:heme-degrading monooxygenase HmoA